MATIANAIDFVREELLSAFGSEKSDLNKSNTTTNTAGLKAMLYGIYFVMAAVMLYAHDIALIQWREDWSWLSFSAFCGSMWEFMGLAFLCLKVHTNKSVAGVSAQSMGLFAVGLMFRVATTCIFDGYLPVDASGDVMVQMMDTGSLLCAFFLLYASQKKYVHTYQHEDDTLSVAPILLSCAVSAFFIHGELNHNMFDKSWAFSLNCEVFQLVPQLYMMAKVGGVVDAATAHFVANVVLACLSRFVFWVWAVPGCTGLSHGSYSDIKFGGVYILIAYLLQTLISLDFVYYYVKAWRGGTSVYLPRAGEEI